MQAAFPRVPQRKRHSAGPGDTAFGHRLAPIDNTPYRHPMAADGNARAHSVQGDIAAILHGLAQVRFLSPAYWHSLGANLHVAGRYGEARTALREARKLAPHDIEIALSLAHLEMECGRHQHAYAMFQIVLRRLPLLAEARIRAARVCYELGINKRARSLIEGRSFDNLDDDLSAELAALLIQLENLRDGLSMLEKIPDLSRVSIYARVCLAIALEQTSCLAKALECVASLPSPKSIGNPVLREGILGVRARLAWRNGDLSMARSLLGFLNTPPAPGICRSTWMYFLLAEVCYRQSDMEAAQSALDAAHSILVKAADMTRLRVSSAFPVPQHIHPGARDPGAIRLTRPPAY